MLLTKETSILNLLLNLKIVEPPPFLNLEVNKTNHYITLILNLKASMRLITQSNHLSKLEWTVIQTVQKVRVSLILPTSLKKVLNILFLILVLAKEELETLVKITSLVKLNNWYLQLQAKLLNNKTTVPKEKLR